ncbi:MAG TPA: hypothetical protein VHI13_14780 [Candidatus Kapabacteria bacterium]|nr:hypothetical protein [Candidatus Kapabacteria bacterium]
MKRTHREILIWVAALFAACSLALGVVAWFGYRPIPYGLWGVPNAFLFILIAVANRDAGNRTRSERLRRLKEDRRLAPAWIRWLLRIVYAGLIVQLGVILGQAYNHELSGERLAWEVFPGVWLGVLLQVIAQQMGALQREMHGGDPGGTSAAQHP